MDLIVLIALVAGGIYLWLNYGDKITAFFKSKTDAE